MNSWETRKWCFHTSGFCCLLRLLVPQVCCVSRHFLALPHRAYWLDYPTPTHKSLFHVIHHFENPVWVCKHTLLWGPASFRSWTGHSLLPRFSICLLGVGFNLSESCVCVCAATRQIFCRTTSNILMIRAWRIIRQEWVCFCVEQVATPELNVETKPH